MGRKYVRIFALGHYLFLVAHSFPRASLSENCSLLGTDNVRGQISKHIFAPNGAYCLYNEDPAITNILFGTVTLRYTGVPLYVRIGRSLYKGENNFKSRPENRVLVPLRVLFEISDKKPSIFLYRSLPSREFSAFYKWQKMPSSVCMLGSRRDMSLKAFLCPISGQ